MNVNWITYNNKRILRVDYRGLTHEEMIKQLEFESELILSETKPVLYLGIFTDVDANGDFLRRANELGKRTERRTQKSAILGITGIKKIALKTYKVITGADMTPFDNEQDALEYLTRDK
jgi:hypothetical protein